MDNQQPQLALGSILDKRVQAKVVEDVGTAVNLKEAWFSNCIDVVADWRHPWGWVCSIKFNCFRPFADFRSYFLEVVFWVFKIIGKVLSFVSTDTIWVIELRVEPNLLQFSGIPKQAAILWDRWNELSRNHLFKRKTVQKFIEKESHAFNSRGRWGQRRFIGGYFVLSSLLLLIFCSFFVLLVGRRRGFLGLFEAINHFLEPPSVETLQSIFSFSKLCLTISNGCLYFSNILKGCFQNFFLVIGKHIKAVFISSKLFVGDFFGFVPKLLVIGVRLTFHHSDHHLGFCFVELDHYIEWVFGYKFQWILISREFR